MSKPRDPAKERFWRHTLEQFHASGLSVAAFCRLHHLPPGSLYAWRRTLADRDRQAAAADLPQFVPVLLPAPAGTNDAPAAFELLLPQGRVLRVPASFDADSLRRLLAVLEQPGEAPPC